MRRSRPRPPVDATARRSSRWRRPPPDRALVGRERVHLLVGHRRAHPARADAVGPHAVWTVIEREALGEHREARLRRAVRKRLRCRAEPCGRGDGDDRATSCRELGDRRLSHQEDTRQVGADDLVPGLGREVVERAFAADAGVAHERVEPTEGVDHGGDRASAVRCDSRVGDDPETVELGRHLLERRGAATGHGDAIAIGGEPPGDGGADPRSASGDERDSPRIPLRGEARIRRGEHHRCPLPFHSPQPVPRQGASVKRRAKTPLVTTCNSQDDRRCPAAHTRLSSVATPTASDKLSLARRLAPRCGARRGLGGGLRAELRAGLRATLRGMRRAVMSGAP